MSILYKKIAYFLFITLSFLFSVSAPPFPFEIQQADGSKITVRMFGDEYYNWMETVDGYVIEFAADEHRSGWYYSTLNENGKYTASETLVIHPAPGNLNIPKHLQEISPQVRNFNYTEKNIGFVPDKPLFRRIADNTLNPLVFLVDFSDEEHKYTPSQFNHLLFAENLSPISANFPADHYDYTMSVRDYYDEISNGKQNIIGEIGSIVGWRRADTTYSYYVDGVQGTGQGNGPNESNNYAKSAAALVVETAMALDDDIDFNKFDNGYGAIDVVILIVAGKGVPFTDDNYFWPHMSSVPDKNHGLLDIDPNAPSSTHVGYFAPDGVVIQKYIVIHEQYGFGYSGAEVGDIHPIGTICHELGHVLGLPDLYDSPSVGSRASGIGEWGLMGSGNYLSQTSPAYMSAWSRYKLGYIVPDTIENKINYPLTIYPAEGAVEGAAYILPLDSNTPQEYLILENRQKNLSDKNLPGSGLLVWHIDETITDIYPLNASVNENQNFYGVNLLQADGLWETYGSCSQIIDKIYIPCADNGDPFPLISDPSAILTELTNPSTDTYSYDRDADGEIEMGGDSGIKITNIVESNQIITLTVTNPNVNGNILSYDDNDIGIWSSDAFHSSHNWTGIKFQTDHSTVLSGVLIPYIESTTEYEIKIWEGWGNDRPTILKNYHTGIWNPGQEFRDYGWAFISLLDDYIPITSGEDYYIEVYYPQLGATKFFDYSLYGSSVVSDLSYYRSDSNSDCNIFNIGDWNIRAVLSGQNCGVHEDMKVWPGDTDGNLVVDADDILPIGVYYGHQGCYRQGDSYSWEAQPLPNGWEAASSAYADANGDGKVDIADVLVILVNWTPDIPVSSSSDDFNYTEDEEMARYRDNFYEIYQSLSGSSEPTVSIRRKLEELFGFGMLPSKYILGQNYPNPFNPRTVIPYYASDAGDAEVVIYDIEGRVVKKLAHSHNGEGWYELVFMADEISSGVYFYKLVANGEVKSINKMLLLK